jgi:uncharacterized protein
MKPRLGVPDLGVGVGLRIPHYRAILDETPAVDWFECISENFMVEGGKPLFHLDAVRANYPLVLHGVSGNLGGVDPLDREYLKRLRALVRRVNAPWASDHLCWNGAGGKNLHDLLPLPMTRETVKHVAERIRAVQDTLEVRFAIENVSSYMTYRDDEMKEEDMVAEIADAADCGILLDVNNVYVSSRNHGFDPEAYLDRIPAERVVQIHLAGHTDKGKYLLDTHSDHVCDDVWSLYRRACRRIGPCSTLIEWDDCIPDFPVLLAEADKAKAIRREVLGDSAAA